MTFGVQEGEEAIGPHRLTSNQLIRRAVFIIFLMVHPEKGETQINIHHWNPQNSLFASKSRQIWPNE